MAASTCCCSAARCRVAWHWFPLGFAVVDLGTRAVFLCLHRPQMLAFPVFSGVSGFFDVSESSLAVTLDVSAVFCFFTVGRSIATRCRRQNLVYNRSTSCCILIFSLVDRLRPVQAEIGRFMTSTRGNLRVVCPEASVPSPLIFFWLNKYSKG